MGKSDSFWSLPRTDPFTFMDRTVRAEFGARMKDDIYRLQSDPNNPNHGVYTEAESKYRQEFAAWLGNPAA